MIKDLKQVLGEEYCLACKGCCRFQSAQSLWRPKVYPSEEVFSKRDPVNKDILDKTGRIATQIFGKEHICAFLDPLTNKCRTYSSRPFECQLYPFVFIKEDQGLVLGAHLACPFVQDAQASQMFERYCKDLEGFFHQPTMQSFLAAHLNDISSSHIQKDEIQILFRLSS